MPRWIRQLGLSQRRLSIVTLVLVIAILVLAVVLRNQLPGVEAAGYPAVFLISLVGNATLIFPVPAIAVVCTGGSFLNPLLVGLVGGVGQATGEMTGYLAGFGGQGLFIMKGQAYQRVQSWVQRRGWLVVLSFALIPTPFFDVAGLAAGSVRMPVWQFFTAAAVGKTIRSIAIAYGCRYGYDFFRVLGEAGA